MFHESTKFAGRAHAPGSDSGPIAGFGRQRALSWRRIGVAVGPRAASWGATRERSAVTVHFLHFRVLTTPPKIWLLFKQHRVPAG